MADQDRQGATVEPVGPHDPPAHPAGADATRVDDAHGDMGAALDDIEAALDEVAATISRMS